MKKINKKAFSLIELSIVILIISVLVTGSLGISRTVTNSSKNDVTQERMDIVYKALTNFLAVNKRLPCPASSTAAKGGNTGTSTTPNNMAYGTETGAVTTGVVGTGVCAQAFASSTNAPNLAWGMVPIIALGLDADMAEDGFGMKFSYVVDKRFTAASVSTASTTGFEITKSAPDQADTIPVDLGGINPQSPSGTSLLENQNGVLVLISHGANKYNGFSASSTSQNSASAITDENNNSCNENGTCNTSGTTSFNRVFVTNSTDPNFDDVVLFKNKTQLVKDAGLEFIMCNGNEADTATPTYTDCASTPTNNLSWTTSSVKNGYYGDKIYSNGGSCFRTCGRYGVWGTATAVNNTTSTVSFRAYNSTSRTNVTGSGETYLIVCNTVLDSDSGYSSTTGVFTAPVTGTYVFTAGVGLGGIDTTLNTAITFGLQSTDAFLEIFQGRVNNATMTASGSFIVNMDANETIQPTVIVSGSATGVDVRNAARITNFAGYLLP